VSVDLYNGIPFFVYNPKNLPVEHLPVVFGYDNDGWYALKLGRLIAEDGTILAKAESKSSDLLPYELGLLEGYKTHLQTRARLHYPHGFRMEYVAAVDVKLHPNLQRAFFRFTLARETKKRQDKAREKAKLKKKT